LDGTVKIIYKLFLFLLLCAPAFAKERTAAELYKSCTSTTKYDRGVCDGFVEGWAAGIDGNIIRVQDDFYIVVEKSDTTTAEKRAAFVSFVKEHPDVSDRSADAVLLFALGEAKLAGLVPIVPADDGTPKQVIPL
jgi:hypothetical protein